jgi:hypothetical protein
MTSFRVYGPVGENDSLSRVAAGMLEGLRSNGAEVTFFDLCNVLDDDDGLTPGYDADIGVYVGPPNYLSVMAGRGQHSQRLVWIFPNSSWLPPEIMREAAKYCTAILTATKWGADVVRNHSLGLPVMLWRLGVDAAFVLDPYASTSCGPWRVLHLSSTRLSRKGTDRLIHAWACCKANGSVGEEAELDLVLSGDLDAATKDVEQASDEFGCEPRIHVLPRLNLSSEDMARFYRRYDLVCQPSRAEGFGLCPLEARACGISICATDCTGHAEHIHGGLPGVVVVATGADGALDDGPGAQAPLLWEHDICKALSCAYEHRIELGRWARSGSADVRQKWNWKQVTAEFLHGELGA